MEKQHKSTCLACGKEWYYTRKDLLQSKLNRSKNESKKNLINTTSVLGNNKLSETINAISDLPEVAHQCPACGSRNVTLEVIKDDAQKEQDTKLIKFIIVCAVIAISILTISLCATVIIFKINSSDNNVQNNVAETTITTSSQTPTPIPTQTPTPIPTDTPAPTPIISPQTPVLTNNECIIGSDRTKVRALLKNRYKETKSIMGENALDFENDDLLITVFFSSEGKADGVFFMQNSFDGVDSLTGEGSYVSQHYDELVKLSTNDPNIKIESDYTKYNSKGIKKAPMELYIGNIPF